MRKLVEAMDGTYGNGKSGVAGKRNLLAFSESAGFFEEVACAGCGDPGYLDAGNGPGTVSCAGSSKAVVWAPARKGVTSRKKSNKTVLRINI